MMNLLTKKNLRKLTGGCFLFLCLAVSACGNSNNAESTQPDPGLNAEEGTAAVDQKKQ
ncbi:hypothetical protein [Gimesia fumaroli]|jgi:ABC-type Fe3+-citrate transport system substrate-binding protein|uniref:Uncharacterized protein n=1 Tax=Gimesia fumaroli TaxID=2527976 RepID=A0A518I595_9PLAN|nr:hypothetical protein [Gimesia fumaroli]QDV48225.1 hypothetical protein Enr17x_02360 [Gimesia fumaroli]